MILGDRAKERRQVREEGWERDRETEAGGGERERESEMFRVDS